MLSFGFTPILTLILGVNLCPCISLNDLCFHEGEEPIFTPRVQHSNWHTLEVPQMFDKLIF